nr:MAG TPA: hypothetical protein [Caudoviricetes sp.]
MPVFFLAFPFWESGEHPLPYSCFPRRGKCLRKQTIEVDSNFFIFPSLPLGGKVDKAKLWTNDGQPNNIQAFFSKSRFTSNRFPGFPVGEAVGFCRLKRSFFFFACLPPFLTSSLPLGGKVDKAKLWTNEGQPNNNQAFFSKKPLYTQPAFPASPVGEAVGFCRLKRSLHAFPP